jgi:hypothetical protein
MTSLFGYYSNIVILCSRFIASQKQKTRMTLKVHTRYRRIVEERKNIENNFYANDSPNNDLNS